MFLLHSLEVVVHIVFKPLAILTLDAIRRTKLSKYTFADIKLFHKQAYIAEQGLTMWCLFLSTAIPSCPVHAV